MPRIALVGDDRGHPSHRELNALLPRLRDEAGVNAQWVPTTSGLDMTQFDGVWLVPGSPYDDDTFAYSVITTARTQGVPFLGTCGGHQYAVIEYLRNVLGRTATHAESEGAGDDNAVAALACSLYGEERAVTPTPGSRFSEWVSAPFTGMHYCNYAPVAGVIEHLVKAGIVIGATAPDTTAEVLEFPNHRFFVTSLFQPHIGASRGEPLHPLITAFAKAVTG